MLGSIIAKINEADSGVERRRSVCQTSKFRQWKQPMTTGQQAFAEPDDGKSNVSGTQYTGLQNYYGPTSLAYDPSRGNGSTSKGFQKPAKPGVYGKKRRPFRAYHRANKHAKPQPRAYQKMTPAYSNTGRNCSVRTPCYINYSMAPDSRTTPSYSQSYNASTTYSPQYTPYYISNPGSAHSHPYKSPTSPHYTPTSPGILYDPWASQDGFAGVDIGKNNVYSPAYGAAQGSVKSNTDPFTLISNIPQALPTTTNSSRNLSSTSISQLQSELQKTVVQSTNVNRGNSEVKQSRSAKAKLEFKNDNNGNKEHDDRLEYDPTQPQYSPTYDPDPTNTLNEKEYHPYFPGYHD